jgi:hypothetical protein
VKEDGVTKNKRTVIKNIGPLSRFDDGKPDFILRLRQSFKEGNPIIDDLKDFATGNFSKNFIKFEIDLNSDKECFSDPKNIGYLLLDGFYDSLGIYDVLNKFKSQSKISYDLNGISKLFIFNRVLCPDSKFGAFEERDRYMFPVSSSNQLIDIYRSLDCLDSVADSIQTRMNHKISSMIGRNTEVCYYDVTNYYFEIPENDEDKIAENGEVIHGLRKKGPSKEKRGEPIVQMGLFIDDNGIPIAYRLFPGNNIDQTTLRPAMKKTLDKMNFNRVIIIADGGLNSGQNIAHILSKGNGYIVSKSTKKTDKSTRKWILDENGYLYNEHETFKVKSIVRTRNIKDENNNVITIKEKLISYWSKKHYELEKHENYNFIQYMNSVIDNPDKLKDKP